MVQVSIGDVVTLNGDHRYWRVGNASDRTIRVGADVKLVVTRVYTNHLIARGPVLANGGAASVSVEKSSIVTVNGLDAVTGVKHRELGEKPEDTADITYIDVNHPGIQWLFEDMGKVADDNGWCSEYDELAERLGIPGRNQEFFIDTLIAASDERVEAMSVAATVRAKTYEEAVEIAKETVANWRG